MNSKLILGAAIGECIHVAGLLSFLKLAEDAGYETVFLGPAVGIDVVVEQIKRRNPGVVALSYRLSPGSCLNLLETLAAGISSDRALGGRRYVFGCTTATATGARQTGIFERVFDGTEPEAEVRVFLADKPVTSAAKPYPAGLVERIAFKRPIPLLRHHIGLPTMKETVDEVRLIAEAGVLDIVSVAPDQTAQESFFRPRRDVDSSAGAGGVPLRRREDLVEIYQASRCGNYPLVRCYSGTNDVMQWAEMLRETINNAWCAVPLCWYSVLDRRSPRSVKQAAADAQQLMRWHAERDTPVEMNEAHQWSLRRAPDSVGVAMALIAAYNAKQMGVKHYVSQYMLNTPGEISPVMDLAKMLAEIEMVESLHDGSFHSYRQARLGLLGFPADLDAARGQMSLSIILGLMLDPQIIHVVAYCEGQYAATSKEIIESCKMAEQLIKGYRRGFPQHLLSGADIGRRKAELIDDANAIIEAVKTVGKNSRDPLTDPEVIEAAIRIGLLDAPDLKGNEIARGEIVTAMVDGACVSVDGKTRKPLPERERLRRTLDSLP